MLSVALGPEMMREEAIDSNMFDRDNESVSKGESMIESKIKHPSFSRIYESNETLRTQYKINIMDLEQV
jgi:DUF438 domain-containing protein